MKNKFLYVLLLFMIIINVVGFIFINNFIKKINEQVEYIEYYKAQKERLEDKYLRESSSFYFEQVKNIINETNDALNNSLLVVHIPNEACLNCIEQLVYTLKQNVERSIALHIDKSNTTILNLWKNNFKEDFQLVDVEINMYMKDALLIYKRDGEFKYIYYDVAIPELTLDFISNFQTDN